MGSFEENLARNKLARGEVGLESSGLIFLKEIHSHQMFVINPNGNVRRVVFGKFFKWHPVGLEMFLGRTPTVGFPEKLYVGRRIQNAEFNAHAYTGLVRLTFCTNGGEASL